MARGGKESVDIDIVLGIAGIPKVEKTARDLRDLSEKGLLTISSKTVNTMLGQAVKASQKFTEIFAQGAEVGLNVKQLSKILDVQTSMDKLASDNIRELEAAASALKRLEATGTKEQITEKKALISRLQTRQASLEKEMRDRLKNEVKLIERRRKGYKQIVGFMDKSTREQAETLTEGISEGVSGAFRKMESGDIMGGVTGLLSGAKGLTSILEGVAAGASGAGGAIGALAGAAGSLAMVLGPLVVTFGAVAAVAGAIYAVDNAAKELNKTLLESGSIGDLFGGGQLQNIYQVERALNTVREATTNWANNRAWRTTAEEQTKIIASFNEAGLSVARLTGNIEDQAVATRKLREATATALTYSNLLGISTEQVAQDTASYMESLALTLNEVQLGFSATFQAAQQAGIGTKRFYTMVQGATSGTALYNIRIEEAANLLTLLSKAMSPRAAQEFLQKIATGFGQKGMTERMKEIMWKGAGKFQAIMKKSSDVLAVRFGKEFGESYSDVFAGFGIAIEGKKGEEIIKQLRGKSTEEQQELIAQLTAQGANGAKAAQRLQQLLQASRNYYGKPSVGDLAIAGSQADMGAKLAWALELNAGKPLKDMGAVMRMFNENNMDVSQEQIEELVRVDNLLRGNYRILQGIQSEAEKGNESTLAVEEQIRKYGAYVDPETKKIMRATLDQNGEIIEGSQEQINQLNDLAIGSAHLFGATEEGLTKDQAIAKEVVKNTENIASVLKSGTNALLQEANTFLRGIWNEALGGEGVEALKDIQGKQENLADSIEAAQKKLESDQEKALKMDDADKKIAEEGIKRQQEQIQAMEKQMELLRSVEQNVAIGQDIGEATENAIREVFPEQADKIIAQADEQSSVLKDFQEGFEWDPAMMVASALGGGIPGAAMLGARAAQKREEHSSENLLKAAEEQAKLDEEALKTREEDTAKGTEKGVKKAQRELEAEKLVAAAGISRGTEEFSNSVQSLLRGKLTESVQKGLERTLATFKDEGVRESVKARLASKAMELGVSPDTFPSAANDFIWRAGQGVLKINNADDIVGTKPGGPLAGGGSQVFNFNINGIQDIPRLVDIIEEATMSGRRR